jgi:hypothetical protein
MSLDPPHEHRPRRTPAPAEAARVTPGRVLAALERAALHRGERERGVALWAILDQLALPRRGRGARQTRELLTRLADAGAVRASRRRGVALWTLTAAGARLLRRAREVGASALPESPQHRAWRQARALAAREVERLRDALRDSLSDASALLAAEPPAPSQRWFDLAERLRRDAWLVGSASHCMYEWNEPDDRQADIDDGPPGRRNVALWREQRD